MEEPNYSSDEDSAALGLQEALILRSRAETTSPTTMPRVYRPPLGGPLRWQDDASGELPRVMLAFFERRRKLTPAEIERVRDYGEYYIDAPMWGCNPYVDEEGRAYFARLRTQIKVARTVGDLDQWIHACLEIGIDPY
ncbi:MAG: hypothetical protein IVW53_15865 [Chloroflexi bacterium]|nr:hypothetical protein [Chloroflexota bacterium]